MAEKKEEFEMNNFSSSLQFFEKCVRVILSETLTYSDGTLLELSGNFCKFGALLKSKLSKTPKKFKCGDLIVTLLKESVEIQELEALKDVICQSPSLKQYLLSSNVDQYNSIHFFIDRTIFIKNVLEMVITSGPKYGEKRDEVNKQVLINATNVVADYGSEDEQTVGELRTILLCNHLVEVLQQSRYAVRRCDCFINLSLEGSTNIPTNNALIAFGISQCNIQQVPMCLKKLELVSNILKSNLLKSQYKIDTGIGITKDPEFNHNEFLKNKSFQDIAEKGHSSRAHAESSTLEDQDSGKIRNCSLFLPGEMCLADQERAMSLGNIRLNLHKFLEELKTFKRGDHSVAYDKNLKELDVTSVWNDLCYLEMIADEVEMQDGKDKNTTIIHVCGQEKQFHLQKIALAWRILTERYVAEKQIFTCHGSVAFHGGTNCLNKNISVGELLRIRTMQVKHSYLMKYGPIVNDETWIATIAKIAISVIKLEILLAPLKAQVKVEVTDSNECPPSCRQALFVLYNCARLAKIMEHYEKAVEKGIYPLLPGINQVDFSLLKDEAEWSLVMKYVVSYPDIVAKVAQCLQDGKFTSNKIALFLVSLSQDISVYYSRVHILGEPRTHLLPTMFARLYLVKVLRQVIQNALQLLNIESIDQM